MKYLQLLLLIFILNIPVWLQAKTRSILGS